MSIVSIAISVHSSHTLIHSMQSDEEFCGEPARCVSPSASDAEFVGNSDCVLAAPKDKGRGRRARPADPCMYLVSSSTKSGLWPGLAPPGESGDDRVSGILLVQWELVDDEPKTLSSVGFRRHESVASCI